MDTTPLRWPALVAALAAILLTSCGELPAPRHRGANAAVASTGSSSGTSDSDPSNDDDDEDAAEKLADAAKEARDSRDDAGADLEESRIELKLTELRSKRERADEEVALGEAERTLVEAKGELKHFLEIKLAHRKAEAELGLDRAKEWAEQAAMELKELEAMYAEEEFASMTKELVLRRGKKSQEFASRGLANQQTDLRTLTQYDLPKKQRDLEQALDAATRGAQNAKGDLTIGNLDRQLTLLRARREVRGLEKKVKDTGEKLVKAESKLAAHTAKSKDA